MSDTTSELWKEQGPGEAFTVATPAEILAAARNLPGAFVDESWWDDFGHAVTVDTDGRYLVIPLSDEEKK